MKNFIGRKNHQPVPSGGPFKSIYVITAKPERDEINVGDFNNIFMLVTNCCPDPVLLFKLVALMDNITVQPIIG